MSDTAFEGTITLPYKNISDHLRGLWKHRGVFAQHFTASLLCLGALYQVAATLQPQHVSLCLGMATGTAISLLYGVWRTMSAYYNDVPSSIGGNAFLKRVYFRQREGWTLVITHNLIREKVGQLQSQYERLCQESKFVPLRWLSEADFLHWVATKSTECGRLLSATEGTVFKRLMPIIGSVKSDADYSKLMDGVTEVSELCDAIIDYETSLRSVWTDSQYAYILPRFYGVTETFVNGIVELNDWLRRIGEGERAKDGELLWFNYKFELPDKLTSLADKLPSVD